MPPTATLPSSLRANAQWQRLGPDDVPALLVVPPDIDVPPPVVLWMHGRTVNKELDPGRYLRWMRAGIGTCAVDLPGHGERLDEGLLDAERSFEVISQMVEEIDGVLEALGDLARFDTGRVAIGGVSAGGMAALARLCRPHAFRCASVEATSGAWSHQRSRPMFTSPRGVSWEQARQLDPLSRLDGWREIPLLILHARYDEWMPIEGQREFAAALRARSSDAGLIELVEYGRTGAPHEHVGFGSMAADAKNRQTAFLRRWLVETA